jgi:hypothetical protein
MLAVARRHAVADAMDALRASHQAETASAMGALLQRYTERLAAIMRELPELERAAAMARLKDEQVMEQQALQRMQQQKLRDEKNRVLSPVKLSFASASAYLKRKHREERCATDGRGCWRPGNAMMTINLPDGA